MNWHKLSEEQPIEDCACLIWIENKGYKTDYWYNKETAKRWRHSQVTHWLKIEPPEAK